MQKSDRKGIEYQRIPTKAKYELENYFRYIMKKYGLDNWDAMDDRDRELVKTYIQPKGRITYI